MTTDDPPLERVEMTVASRRAELPQVGARLDELATRWGLPLDAVADMQVALDEVLANILTHAYADAAPHAIRIALAVYPGVLEAEVEDDGRPFDPLAVAPPDRSPPAAAREVGGLGIHFVRRLMSEVAYRRVGDRNRLVLTRVFGVAPG